MREWGLPSALPAGRSRGMLERVSTARAALLSCVLVALGSACGLATVGEADVPAGDAGFDAGSDVPTAVDPDGAAPANDSGAAPQDSGGEGATDSAPVVGDTSTPSGHTDTGVADSEPSNDAADSAALPDSADAADSAALPDAADTAPALGFCASQSPQPTFCDDFDETTDAGAGWDGVIAGGGTSTVVDGTFALSAPDALHTTTSSGNTAGLTKAFTVSSMFKVDLDILFRALPSMSGDLAPLVIQTSAHWVEYYVDADQAYLQWGENDYSTTFLGGPSLGTWHHVTITITVGAQASLTGSIDGMVVWSNFSLGSLGSAPELTLQVGTPGLFQVMSAETFIDNVVVTAH
jgi:hypothetical protein